MVDPTLIEILNKISPVAEHLTVTVLLLAIFWLILSGKLRLEREVKVIEQRAVASEAREAQYRTERNAAFDELKQISLLVANTRRGHG